MKKSLKTITFEGDPINVLSMNDQSYISIKSLCSILNIDYTSHVPVLLEDERYIDQILDIRDADPVREVQDIYLPNMYVLGWLFSEWKLFIPIEIRHKVLPLYEFIFNYFLPAKNGTSN